MQSGWLKRKGGAVAQSVAARDGGPTTHKGAERGKRGVVPCCYDSGTLSQKKERKGGRALPMAAATVTSHKDNL